MTGLGLAERRSAPIAAATVGAAMLGSLQALGSGNAGTPVETPPQFSRLSRESSFHHVSQLGGWNQTRAVDPRQKKALHEAHAHRGLSNNWVDFLSNQLGRKTPFAAIIKSLIEGEQVPRAKRVLRLALADQPTNPELRDLERLLRPSTATPVAQRDFDRQSQWQLLATLTETHAGQWVAIGRGGLLASDSNLKNLVAWLKKNEVVEAPLIHKLA